ncbi:MAG TPA: carbon storage regulator CsrA [Candidatus Baltobacteraceae bacterium]|jgi:carbon storage regulator|nr:carbon storage regulator CsrA [Candidatus Baltobacteraceae bacterium]
MLVLSRKINQAIVIGNDVRIVIVSVDRDQVKIGIEAPREISVHRSEIYEEIKRTNGFMTTLSETAVRAAPPLTSIEAIAKAPPAKTIISSPPPDSGGT